MDGYSTASVGNGKTKKAAQGLSFVEEMRWVQRKEVCLEDAEKKHDPATVVPHHAPPGLSQCRPQGYKEKLHFKAPESDTQDVSWF